MYYKPWCPTCDKPKIRTIQYLNLYKCLMYLEAHGHKGVHDRVWDHMVDQGLIKNDTKFGYHFPEEDEPYMKEQQIADMRLIKDTWEIEEDHIHFEVSW